jgi:hypothetical protein
MKTARSPYDYIHFVRRYTQLKKVFVFSQGILDRNERIGADAVAKLLSMNSQRQATQRILSHANESLGRICYECGGLCCMGDYDHFSASDYWMRRHSERPIEGYGEEDENGLRNYRLIRDRLTRILGNRDVLFTTENRTGCPYLGGEGCKLDPVDRPLRCVAFTCVRLRKEMTPGLKKEYAECIQELYIASLHTFHILKDVSGTKKHFGKVRLITTI